MHADVWSRETFIYPIKGNEEDSRDVDTNHTMPVTFRHPASTIPCFHYENSTKSSRNIASLSVTQSTNMDRKSRSPPSKQALFVHR